MRLAREKAESVLSRRPASRVLGADTVVVIGGALLGKPRDEADARRMLRALAGRTHRVITGVAFRSRGGWRNHSACSVTSVRFAPLTRAQIDWYVTTGEPMDKAGAYAVQGRASLFVRELRGSYSNVIGLPLEIVFRELGLPA
jgi:septum formation protein